MRYLSLSFPPRPFLYSLILVVLLAAAATAAALAVSLTQAQAANGVYDTNGNGLIEITYLEQLDAVRYDVDGDGIPDQDSGAPGYAGAYPTGESQQVCDQSCGGYELMQSLDFDDPRSYGSDRVNSAWTVGEGWTPIIEFASSLEGNGYTISNLRIAAHGQNDIGLFGYAREDAGINNIGLLNVELTGGNNVGALIGYNYGSVSLSYSTGVVSGAQDVGGLVGENDPSGNISMSYSKSEVRGNNRVGGLVGFSRGAVSGSYSTGTVTGGTDYIGGLIGIASNSTTADSYATGAVSGSRFVGGLIGYGQNSAIANTYATGAVSGHSNLGGLIGIAQGVTASWSYWDTETSGVDASSLGLGKTTAELQEQTGNSGIYNVWNPRTWDFGTSSQYPALKSDMDGDGVATAAEFGGQGRTPPGPQPTPTRIGSTVEPTSVVGSGERYKSLSSGATHVCLLRDDGVIDCGGSNSHGQASPPASGRYLSVDNGDTYSCALRDDGAVICWGSISGTFTTSNPPPIVSPPSEPTPSPTAPRPQPTATRVIPASDSCVSVLESDGTVSGEWTPDCESANRDGGYARYYTFTIADPRIITITLESDDDADTYLNLLAGAGTGGEILHFNDDDGDTSRSWIQELLLADTYTIEATTYGAGETGSFTLTLEGT